MIPRLGSVRLDSELVRHRRVDCRPTITVCGCVRHSQFSSFWIGSNRRADSRHCCMQAISDLSFTHNGEYPVIAGAGNYVDIVCASIFLPFL
jgi:hypothetical protein